ncbi:uncharacterized protein LOC121829773 [Peromyscus maniculatus bairdii]|uniref:uncharacterized protein LOC121829773 n=1 Tax=Peromyscus maniculatus bairdii TaxID=230844 RepID=UPI003FD15722
MIDRLSLCFLQSSFIIAFSRVCMCLLTHQQSLQIHTEPAFHTIKLNISTSDRSCGGLLSLPAPYILIKKYSHFDEESTTGLGSKFISQKQPDIFPQGTRNQVPGERPHNRFMLEEAAVTPWKFGMRELWRK